MNLRLANSNDLPKIKDMYSKIINNMNNNNIDIWDDIYPNEFFNDDIENKCLYLLVEKNGDIVAAFALNEFNDGENYVAWERSDKKALYIDRVGVNIDYLRRGVGSALLEYAVNIAKAFINK